MSGRDDYHDEMRLRPLDDAGTEALLAGEPAASGDHAHLAAFIGDMRACASLPPPAPSPALAALLSNGSHRPLPAAVPLRASPGAGAARPWSGWRRRLAVTGLGFSVTVTGVVGAGAAGLLPEAAERVVAGLVETLTPLHLPNHGDVDKGAVARPGDPARFRGRPGSPPGSAVPGGPGAGVTGDPGWVRQPGDATGAGRTPGGSAPAPPGPFGGPVPDLTAPGVGPPPGPNVGPLPTTPATPTTTLPVAPPTIPDVTTPPVRPPVSPVNPSTTAPRLPR